MPKIFAGLLAGCLSFVAGAGHAQMLSLVEGPLVDHPVKLPNDGRSAGVWRAQVGAWGEQLGEELLRLRGFNEVHAIKSGSNHGIDRLAIKRGPDGKIIDVLFEEIKTSRSPKPRLSSTKYGGTQMSRDWLAANLRKMRNSGDPTLKKLALEVNQFIKASGRPIEKFGEVLHINTQAGTVTGYWTDGRTVKYQQSIERLLKNIQSRGTALSRKRAITNLAQLDQIRATGMTQFLRDSPVQRGRKAVLKSSTHVSRAVALSQSRRAAVTTALQRSAGRLAGIAALAMDAKDLFDTEYAYRQGTISVRQRNTQLVTTIGGIAGASIGASAGASTGAAIGALGGPAAPITVPAGAFTGMALGGIGGYMGGSAVANYGATGWYDSIDISVRDKFELEWLQQGGPAE